MTTGSRDVAALVRRALAVSMLAALASLIAASSAGALTAAPVWKCRASALWASLVDNNRIEPVLANGNPNTALGGNPDRVQCTSEEAGADNLATPAGIPQDFLAAKTAIAKTKIDPELGQALDQKITATSGVEGLTLQLPPGGTVALGIGVANSEATGSCVSGSPVFSGTSKVTDITLGGQSTSLDQLLDQLSAALAPLGDVAELKVNEQIKDASGIIVRAVHLKILRAGAPGDTPVLDLIVAESKAGLNGEVCNAEKQFPFDVCPKGAQFDLAKMVCFIPATDGTPRIDVGRAFEGPSGGTVIPLTEARKKYKSPCLRGPGRAYVVVGTNRRDRITGTNGPDRILGLGGNDSLDGGRGNDCIDGGTGNDRATGGIGGDRVYGMKGNDTLTGNLGKDRLFGSVGNDHLNGGPGADLEDAGAGADTINAGYGRDRVFGRAGRDFINIATQGPSATADCGTGPDKIRLNKKERTRVRNCEIRYVFNDR